MNTYIKYSTLENVEVGEVFIISFNATHFLGWRNKEHFYQSVNNIGETGSFNLDTMDMNEHVLILGNTTSIHDVVRITPWVLGRNNKNVMQAKPAGLDALQSLEDLQQVLEIAESLKNLVAKDLSESLKPLTVA